MNTSRDMSKLTAITNKSFICIQHVDCGVHYLFIISFRDYTICMWWCIGISVVHCGWFTNCSIWRLHLCTQRRQIPMERKQPTTSLLITEHRNTVGPIYREGLIDIKAWIHNHTYYIVWGVIPNPCPDFNDGLTHWGRDKTDATSQTTFSSAFSWMKMFDFGLKFQWSLLLWV